MEMNLDNKNLLKWTYFASTLTLQYIEGFLYE